MFDIVLLRSFQTVAREASFTRAASLLNLTQSAVSTHIRRLEERVNKPLFVRDTRSVALTPDGEMLLGYARAILQLEGDARLRFSDTPRATLIRLGSSDDFMSSWLPAVLAHVQQSRPQIYVEVCVANTGTLLHDLEAGRLDLVVGGRCTGERRGHTLWREPLVWMYAKGASPAKSSAVPLALFPDPCPYRDAALALLAGAGQKWRIAVVSPSVAGLRAAASSGLAVTPLNRSLLTPQLDALGKRSGLPRLPEVEFVIFEAKQKRNAEATVIIDEIVRAASTFRKTMRRAW